MSFFFDLGFILTLRKILLFLVDLDLILTFFDLMIAIFQLLNKVLFCLIFPSISLSLNTSILSCSDSSMIAFTLMRLPFTIWTDSQPWVFDFPKPQTLDETQKVLELFSMLFGVDIRQFEFELCDTLFDFSFSERFISLRLPDLNKIYWSLFLFLNPNLNPVYSLG